MGRDTLMPFCFKYSDGEVKEKWFRSSKDAGQWANMEGDHCVDWWAGKLIQKKNA